MHLLIAKGASTLALDVKARSALQLATLHCGELAVRTLLSSGDLIPALGFKCLLNACILDKPAWLELMLEHTVGSSSSSSNSCGSSSSSSTTGRSASTDASRCTTTASKYTLLHAAAAWGRLQCVGMLLRHGLDAAAVAATGESAAALAAAGNVPRRLQREGLMRPAAPVREQVVLLLLRSGAAVETDLMHISIFKRAVQQFVQELQQQLVAQVQAVTVLANSAYRGCSDGAASANNASSSAAAATTAIDATATAKQHTVRVQLVHASTGHRAYTIPTTLLVALHIQRGEIGASVLANMLVAAPGWSSTAATAGDTTTAANTIKHLQYDDGIDFSELGFECVLQYYYTTIIQGATYGAVDIDKLKATLQAAQFFGLDKLAAAAKQFAQASGVIVQ
jgi:hypothetical protein